MKHRSPAAYMNAELRFLFHIHHFRKVPSPPFSWLVFPEPLLDYLPDPDGGSSSDRKYPAGVSTGVLQHTDLG